MKQDDFITKNQKLWQEFDDWLKLKNLSTKNRNNSNIKTIAEYNELTQSMPHRYRQICHHLSLSQSRNYSPKLVAQLNQLVLQGHQYLYKSNYRRSKFFRFLFIDFPVLIRQEAKLFWISTFLFYVPFIGVIFLINNNPELIYSILSPEQVSDVQYMYNPAGEHIGRNRDADDDFAMFGFYIFNNISISFQVFATGILFCIGSLFFLIFNGLYLGAVAGHLIQIDYTVTFFSFVAGHSALELTAIVISGVAGMRLGLALIKPGRYTRVAALKNAGTISLQLMYGVFLMLLAAAFVEAFWSSKVSIEPQIKYTVGIVMWVILAAYFLLLGRGYDNS
ncbi:MAG: stage II sporulation protein M [Gammaproteobacteria bacterium]